MKRNLAQVVRFIDIGTTMCSGAIASLDKAAFDAPTALPGWTRRHLVAHLAANADAIGRLLHWANTGQRTPMYASHDQRAADIEAGSKLSVAALVSSFAQSAQTLRTNIAAMTSNGWKAEVVTGQGRTVPGSETLWMRSRELFVHAVDLGTGITFADLPHAFLAALRDEILAKRSDENLAVLSGDLPDITAYLAGRAHGPVRTTGGEPAPTLSSWL